MRPGALPVVFMRSVSSRFADTLLGLGGGVVLAAALFSLLIPALGRRSSLASPGLALVFSLAWAY